MTSPVADGAWANPSGQHPAAQGQGWAAPGGPARVPVPAAPPAVEPGPPAYGAPAAYGAPPAYGQPAAYGAPPPRWGAPYQLELRPGIVALRPLAVGDVLDGSLTLLRRYLRPVVAVSVVVAIAVQALGFLIETARAGTDNGGVEAGYLFLTLLLTQLGGLILAGPISALAGEAVLGRPMSMPQLWAKTRPRAPAILVTALLIVLLSVLGFVLAVVPFFLVLVYCAFSTQAAVLEKLPARQAVARSVALVRGSFWRVLGVLLLAGLIAGVVGLVLQTPAIALAAVVTGHFFTSAAAASSTTSRAILSVGAAVAGIFTLSFSAGVHSLLYIDRRMRSEGLDVSLRQAAGTSGSR